MCMLCSQEVFSLSNVYVVFHMECSEVMCLLCLEGVFNLSNVFVVFAGSVQSK